VVGQILIMIALIVNEKLNKNSESRLWLTVIHHYQNSRSRLSLILFVFHLRSKRSNQYLIDRRCIVKTISVAASMVSYSFECPSKDSNQFNMHNVRLPMLNKAFQMEIKLAEVKVAMAFRMTFIFNLSRMKKHQKPDFIVLTFSIHFVQQKDLFCLVKAPGGKEKGTEQMDRKTEGT